jgi:hypothetical protein
MRPRLPRANRPSPLGQEVFQEGLEDVRRVHDAAQAPVDQAQANDFAEERVKLTQQLFDRFPVAASEHREELVQFRGGHVRSPVSGASNR